MDYLICSSNNKHLLNEIKHFCNKKNIQLLSWGKANEANIAVEIKTSRRSSCLNIQWEEKDLSFTCPFTDRANLENVLHTIITALCVNIPIKNIQRHINS